MASSKWCFDGTEMHVSRKDSKLVCDGWISWMASTGFARLSDRRMQPTSGRTVRLACAYGSRSSRGASQNGRHQDGRHQDDQGRESTLQVEWTSVVAVVNKARWSQNRSPSNRDKRHYDTFELLHFDICGPMEENSLWRQQVPAADRGRSQRMHEGSVCCAKSESEDCIKTYIMKVQTQFGKKVKFVRHDGAREFAYQLAQGLLRRRRHRASKPRIPYAHQTNGTAERAIRTYRHDRPQHAASRQAGQVFLGLRAAMTAIYVRTACVTQDRATKTPFEIVYKSKPSVKHMPCVRLSGRTF
ncbi:hypothetical protein Pcac1_g5152 [Phytophthora cactorum]|nr:hypothetical protein Pcac1_g5152 [Phytophthora cactorum]